MEIKGGLEPQRSEKFYSYKKEKAAWGHAAGPRNWQSPGSDWKLGFKAFLLPEGRDFGVNNCLLGRRDVSPVQTGVSWERQGVFFPLANPHFLGTHGSSAVGPSV
jgi:hypothetical protein